MSITVTPSRLDFMAEISGIDLARPLKAADRDAIEDAINRYAVMVFRGQKLTDNQQIDFSAHFGPIAASAQRARHREHAALLLDRRHTSARRSGRSGGVAGAAERHAARAACS